MNEQKRGKRIVLGALAAALAVLVVTGSAPGAGAVDKTRPPGYQGPDLEANCDALDEWEIDTGGYLECGPGGDENSDECTAQNVEGCVLEPLPEWQPPVGHWNGNVAPAGEVTLAESTGDEVVLAKGAGGAGTPTDERVAAPDNNQSATPDDDREPDQGKAKGKGKKGKAKAKGKGKGGRRR